MTIQFDEEGKPRIPKRKIEITPRLVNLIKKANEYNSEGYKIGLKKLKEFQDKFPIDKIKDLTLEKYCYGFENSFCWWVDRGTREIAHMFQEGLNRNWGVWFQKEERQYYSKDGVKKIKIDEETAKSRLDEIKRAIISIINWARDNRFDEIEEEKELWHQAKMKIVYLYFPEKTLPILSKDHLKYICDDIGLVHYGEKNHLESSHKLLKRLKQIEPFKEWGSLKICYFIYSIYNNIFKR